MTARTMKHLKLIPILAFFIPFATSGQVRLPRLISDGMVLQRDANVRIWGWASPHEQISIHFIDSTYRTTAAASGQWSIVLAPLGAGGPYEMHLEATTSTKIRDILVGDVWVCSGQSNMELSMRRASPNYQAEIEASQNDQIRQFLVPQKYNFNVPEKDLQTGTWKAATPETVLDFSAVAYFFARELYERHKIPIGLINASLGGSPAEAWMSEESLKSFPASYAEAQRFKDSSLIREIEHQDQKRIQAWYRLLNEKDAGYKDPRTVWYDPALNTSGWPTMMIPGYWSDTELGPVNGVVWFRRVFDVPPSLVAKPATLILGRIVDADSVFVNGVYVGTTSYQYPPRRYELPANVLHEGQNKIAVRVINVSGRGGFVLGKEYAIISKDTALDLKGAWQYRLGAAMEPLASQTFVRWKPLGLFNGMIAPLLNYRIRGFVWYQGESNAGRPVEYRELLPALIRDWRDQWGDGDYPFLFVQLPNFMESRSDPSESNWALLREAQLMTLSVLNTGMAVTIDVGEWNDIHPLDKMNVGTRLALAAERVAYGDTNIVFSGPTYQSMRAEGDRIILKFANAGTGLLAKGGGELRHFSIAGADKRFVWAKAKIEKDNIIVWNDEISRPVAVRYAWADNPEGANLFNREGLPASPFRTDDWPVK